MPKRQCNGSRRADQGDALHPSGGISKKSARGQDRGDAPYPEEGISTKSARGPHPAEARDGEWLLCVVFRPGDGITEKIQVPDHVKTAAELRWFFHGLAKWSENHGANVLHDNKPVRHVRHMLQVQN